MARNIGSAFSWRSFLKALAAIAVPVALQNLLTTTASMVDTMMVAPLGRPSVGAIGLCAQFSSLMFSCYWGFVGGGSLFIAQYWGSRENDGIERSYGLTLCFMMAVAVIFSGLALFAPNLVMNLYTDKASIQRIGIQYLRVVGFAYPLQVLSICMSALLRSTERVRIPLAASGASVTANLLLNWVFIYGKWGVPAMGVRGGSQCTGHLHRRKGLGLSVSVSCAQSFQMDRDSYKSLSDQMLPHHLQRIAHRYRQHGHKRHIGTPERRYYYSNCGISYFRGAHHWFLFGLLQCRLRAGGQMCGQYSQR